MTTMPLVLVMLMSSSGFAARSDTAQVTFRCPAAGQFVQITHDDKRRGSYRENGQWRDITFDGNVFAPSLSFTLQAIDVHGQQVRCRYRTTSAWSAMYIYTVNRQIISCAPQWNDSRTCWLKDP